MWAREKRIGTCCRDCGERHPACHDHCEKYRAALDEWNNYKSMIKATKEDVYEDYTIKAIVKYKDRRAKNGK